MSQYQVNALGRHYIGFLISFEIHTLQYQMVVMKILRFIASFFCFFKKAAEVGLTHCSRGARFLRSRAAN
jgi:F0F1-type ATP synthase assembly protein I